jgi:hypothetical protein
MDEIFIKRFYRSPAGTAILHLPEFENDEWQVFHRKEGEVSKISIICGHSEACEGTVELIFLPPHGHNVTAKETADLFAATVQKETPALRKVSKGEIIDIPGGEVFSYQLAGKAEKGSLQILNVFGVADGNCSVGILAGGSPDQIDEMSGVAYMIMETLVVGNRIPTLKNRKPGTKLEGVYEGPYEIQWDGKFEQQWFIFDPRGYCHRTDPYSSLELDMDARYQWDPEKVMKYTVRGKKIMITYYDGERFSYTFTQTNDRRITIDGDLYTRIDSIITDNILLEGHYHNDILQTRERDEETDVSILNTDYYFTEELEFKTDSEKEFSGEGTYRMMNNRIYLTFSDGKEEVYTFFPHVKDDVIVSDGYYIGGYYFSRQEK